MKKENAILLGIGGLTIVQNLFNQNNRSINDNKKNKKLTKKQIQLLDEKKKRIKSMNQNLEDAVKVIFDNFPLFADEDEKGRIKTNVKILEAKVKGKVDLGEKPWGISCDAFSGVTTVTKVGDCTMTAKTSNCRKSGDNCVCDVEITTEGNCDL